jgi:hypothetical protein
MKTSLLSIGLLVLLVLVVPVMGQDIMPNDTTKTIILHFHINGDTITFLDSRVVYGHSSDTLDIRDTFTGKQEGTDKTLIRKFGISDPRITYMDSGTKFSDDINFSVKVPFTKNTAGLSIYDTKTNQLLIRADTTKGIADFCTTHPQDPDCSRNPPLVLLVGAGVIIFAGILIGVYFFKKKKNKPAG